MQKYDIKQMRFILIIISICFIFACVVMQAYKYLPETETRFEQYNNQITEEYLQTNDTDEVVDEENSEDVDTQDDSQADEEIEDTTSEEDLDKPVVLPETEYPVMPIQKLQPLESLNEEVENDEIPLIE